MNEGRALQGSPFFGSQTGTQILLDGWQNPQSQSAEDLEIHPDYCNLPKAISYCRYERGLYPEIGTLEKVDNL